MSQDMARRLRALFEMATDGIITMNEGGVMEDVNRAACELFGYAAEELRGQKVNMLMAQHDRTHHDEYLDRYQHTRIPHIIGIGREVTGRHKSGREFPLRLAVSEAVLDDGTIYTGILHDLTEYHASRKRVEDLNRDLESKVIERTAALQEREAELQRALSKERELNELKSRFLSMASHEFKTPLSTLLSSAELIEMYTKSDQQDKRQKHLDRIKGTINQLTEVLNDFLSISQLEQGMTRYLPESVDLRSLLSLSIEASEGQLKPGQVIRLITSEDHCPLVTDPKMLRHVLLNLLSNAAKYSPADATIVLRSQLVNDQLRLSVEDQGIGIPREDQSYLFDRFFRARNVENIPGSGLGLHIVANYVDLLGGSVSFTSEESRGTTFSVDLPCASPPHE
ncbi:MAG: PAS domain-containing sensor histidine kinase [Lewinella sp.]